MVKIGPEEVLRRPGDFVIVDVRTTESRARTGDTISGATWVPSREIGQRTNELPKGRPIVTFCA
jgi:rhodanese-related sulfurtransferase